MRFRIVNNINYPSDLTAPKLIDLIRLSEKQFDELMCSRCRTLFRDRNKSMMETAMCWGFCVGPGWRPLLYSLCSQIQVLCDLTGIEIVVTQIKEKFGTLRFYSDTFVDNSELSVEQTKIITGIIDKLINTADEDSEHICAGCGCYYAHRQFMVFGWTFPFCDECMLKHGEERSAEFIDAVKAIIAARAKHKDPLIPDI